MGKLMPFDKGYKGGKFTSTVNINGKSYTSTTIKDENGNVVYESVVPKIFGIF